MIIVILLPGCFLKGPIDQCGLSLLLINEHDDDDDDDDKWRESTFHEVQRFEAGCRSCR